MANLNDVFLLKTSNLKPKNYDNSDNRERGIKTMNGFQKIDLMGSIQKTPMDAGFGSFPNAKIDSMDETPSSNFKGVMSGLAQNLNSQMNAPDELLKKSMSGDPSVDIHDVMTAMAKAEISISVATQVTSKVIQAYDKIMQISV